MKYLAISILATLTSSASFLAGTGYGFKLGAENGVVIDKVLVGYLSAHQALKLEDPDYNCKHNTKLNLDFDVITALNGYIWYEDKGSKYLAEYFLPEEVSYLEKSMNMIDKYRTLHPERDVSDELNDPKDYLESYRQRKDYLAKYREQHKES